MVFMLNGSTYRIENPRILRHQKGEHHVTDANGVTHVYPTPISGLTVVRWKLREEEP